MEIDGLIGANQIGRFGRLSQKYTHDTHPPDFMSVPLSRLSGNQAF